MLLEIAAVFLRLGATTFGGPAAHVALMEREFVEDRRWIERDRFVEMLGVTNLIPGPNSTELAAEIGRARAGMPGLFVAAACFVAPAMVMMLGLAWLYVTHGAAIGARAFLDGVEPVVVALIAVTVVRLARTATSTSTTAAIALGIFVAVLLGLDEVLALALAGVAAVIARSGGLHAFTPLGVLAAVQQQPVAWVLLLFLKFGATVFGSGYVLIAFLRGDLVERLGWLTEQQLVDAVAAGQVTPGPLFTTATFVGYVLAGVPGALLATVGIFLPGLAMMAAIGPLLVRARRRERWRVALAGLSAGAVGLLAAVAVPLAIRAGRDPVGVLVMAGALAILLARPSWSPVWVIAGGGVVGVLVQV